MKDIEVIKELDYQSSTLVISFAGLGDNFEFRKLFSEYDFKRLYLRDLKHNWYLNGLENIGDDVNGIRAYLEQIIEQENVQSVVTIGCSAGGFAAILYGCLLKSSHIIAFSPQTFMNKMNRLIYYDYRWGDRCKQIYSGDRSNRMYLDLKNIVKNYGGKLSLFYDQKHRLDNIHGRRITSKDCMRFNNLGGGHVLVSKLKKDNLLDYYLSLVCPEAFES